MDLKEAAVLSDTKRHPWELARAKFLLFLLKRQLRQQPYARTVLDVGCGDAFLVSFLAKKLPQLRFLALDNAFSEDDIKRLAAGRQPNLSFYRRLEDIGQPVDFVLLLDVLEHVEDEAGLLRDISKDSRVSPSTVFIITVPAWPQLFTGHDVVLGHYRRYTHNSLVQMFERAGFDKEWAGYFFACLLPLRWWQVLKEKKGKKMTTGTTETASWSGGSLSTKIWTLILAIDARFVFYLQRFFGLKLPGLSAYIIGRRRFDA